MMATLERFWQGTANMEKINRSHFFHLLKWQGAIRDCQEYKRGKRAKSERDDSRWKIKGGGVRITPPP